MKEIYILNKWNVFYLLTITERRKDKNQDKDMVQVRHLLKVGLDQQM